MANQIIKDSKGSIIATIRESSNEDKIYSKSGSHLGTYRKGSNKTYNASGSLIGNGNQLTRLI